MSTDFDIIVVGGGIAGMRAAMDAAAMGANCVIIEKEAEPGGCLGHLSRWFPDDACNLCRAIDADGGRPVQESCLRRKFEHPLVSFENASAVSARIEDDVVVVEIERPGEKSVKTEEIKGKKIIVAGGFNETPVEALASFGHGRLAGVVTALDLEKHLGRSPSGPILRPGDSKEVKHVALLACTGSRDRQTPYCSSACCAYLAKIALLIREASPQTGITLVTMDMRFHGKGHERYREKALEGVNILRGRAAAIEQDGEDLLVKAVDTQGPELVRADLVVLSGGQKPAASDLLEKLGVRLDEYGYPVGATDFNIWRTNIDQVLVAGSARTPGDIPGAILDARAAAVDAVAWAVHEPPLRTDVDISSRTFLVVGAGPAGLGAAIELADAGHRVVLAEKKTVLGGQGLKAALDPGGRDLKKELEKLIDEVIGHENIETRTSTTVSDIKGRPGWFSARLHNEENACQRMKGFTAVIASVGAPDFVPQELKQGAVVTLRKAHELLQTDNLPEGPVVFRQCRGSREPGRPWCNRTCCLSALKIATSIMKKDPSREVWFLHRDVMAPGLYEMLYTEARKAGVRFSRFSTEHEPTVETVGDKLFINFHDQILGELESLSPGLLVLSTGVESPRERLQALGIEHDEDGFATENEPKFRPLRSTRTGIYVAGSCRSPVPVAEAVLQGKAAAAGAMNFALLFKSREEGAAPSYTRLSLCAGCGMCVDACPSSARELAGIPETATVLNALCQACGLCQSVCPSGAAVVPDADLTDCDSLPPFLSGEGDRGRGSGRKEEVNE